MLHVIKNIEFYEVIHSMSLLFCPGSTTMSLKFTSAKERSYSDRIDDSFLLFVLDSGGIFHFGFSKYQTQGVLIIKQPNMLCNIVLLLP